VGYVRVSSDLFSLRIIFLAICWAELINNTFILERDDLTASYETSRNNQLRNIFTTDFNEKTSAAESVVLLGAIRALFLNGNR